MKKITILLTSLLLAFVTGCQDHNLEPHPEDVMAWGASQGISEGFAIAVDGNNNSYVTGIFIGTVTFGSITLTSTGNTSDVFVAKYNSNGEVQWVQKASGAGTEEGHGIAVDESGNVYVTGFYITPTTFGTTTLPSSNTTADIFVAKYNSNGELLWVRRAGGTNQDYGKDIAVDNNGNVYVIGNFARTATFDATSVTSDGNIPDVFVAKYNSSGEVVWVKDTEGSGYDEGYGIALDENGNIFITGSFSGTSTFGTHTLNSTNGGTDIFIAKFNNIGEVQWAKNSGGTSVDVANDIHVDKNDNLYITGSFYDTLPFDAVSITSNGAYDSFLMKLNSNGEAQWARNAGGPEIDYARGVTADKNGNVYMVGYFNDTASFGIKSLTSSGGGDVFIAKYNSDGNIQWAQSAGGPSADVGRSIATNGNGSIYITGMYYGTATFGTTTLSSNSDRHMFIANYKN